MGSLRALLGTGELFGGCRASWELPAPLLPGLTDDRLFMPAFAPLLCFLVSVPPTGCLPSGLSVGAGAGFLPFLTPLAQLVFPPRNGHLEEAISHLFPVPLPVASSVAASSKGGIALLAPDRTVFQARDADEASVCICMLTLQPDRCLSELHIRVTAACWAVC